MTQYCPECRLALATHDKDRRIHFGVAYHSACLVKYLIRISMQRRLRRPIKAP